MSVFRQDTHGHQLQPPLGNPIFEAKKDADGRHVSLANLVFTGAHRAALQ